MRIHARQDEVIPAALRLTHVLRSATSVRMRSSIVAVWMVVLAWGCSRNEAPAPESKPAQQVQPATPAPTPAATAAASGGDGEAKKLFKARCVVCHGQNGKGDGPGAAALNPK